MKLLITGANGQLGRELLRQLKGGGSALGPLPAALQNARAAGVDLPDGDLAHLDEARALVAGCAPDAVIHCAAYTDVDGAETRQDAAFAANAVAPRNVAMACREMGAKLICLSTDYVFDGVGDAPLSEGDVPAPASVYGRTKLLGEAYAQRFCARTFIVRTAWLYGRCGKNFVKTILRLADEKDRLTVVDDQRGNPTNAEDLAHHLLKLCVTEEYGVYHITGGGVTTWYQFAKEILRLARRTDVKVEPCSSAAYKSPAKRPANSALAHTMLRATIGDEMRPWQDALAAYVPEYLEQRRRDEKMD